jgi:hypothetical protein
MQFGELTSAAERVAVRYGPASTSVTQSWVRAPARVEQIAPIVWEHVSGALPGASEGEIMASLATMESALVDLRTKHCAPTTPPWDAPVDCACGIVRPRRRLPRSKRKHP